MNIVLNFGLDIKVTELIFTKLESKISKTDIQLYLNHFRATLISSIPCIDLSFYFFDLSLVYVKKIIMAIEKMKEFQMLSIVEKSKKIKDLIQKGKLRNDEEFREMISKIVIMIIEKGGNF